MDEHDFHLLAAGAANPESERLVDAMLIAGAHEDSLIELVAAIFKRAILDVGANDPKERTRAIKFLNDALPDWRQKLAEAPSLEVRQAAARKRRYEERLARARYSHSQE